MKEIGSVRNSKRLQERYSWIAEGGKKKKKRKRKTRRAGRAEEKLLEKDTLLAR